LLNLFKIHLQYLQSTKQTKHKNIILKKAPQKHHHFLSLASDPTKINRTARNPEAPVRKAEAREDPQEVQEPDDPKKWCVLGCRMHRISDPFCLEEWGVQQEKWG